MGYNIGISGIPNSIHITSISSQTLPAYLFDTKLPHNNQLDSIHCSLFHTSVSSWKSRFASLEGCRTTLTVCIGPSSHAIVAV